MLTNKKLNEVLEYDPDTGLFKWGISRGFIRAGTMAGGNHTGVVTITIDGKLHRAHNLAWRISRGVRDHGTIWHVNGDKTDNRACNLTDIKPSKNKHTATVVATGDGYVVNGHFCANMPEVLAMVEGLLTYV